MVVLCQKSRRAFEYHMSHIKQISIIISHSALNLRFESSFQSKTKWIFRTPHPYINNMNCRSEFNCENSKFIHYRLHKMDIICKAVSMGLFGPYFDYFQIDNKGSVQTMSQYLQCMSHSIILLPIPWNIVNGSQTISSTFASFVSSRQYGSFVINLKIIKIRTKYSH